MITLDSYEAISFGPFLASRHSTAASLHCLDNLEQTVNELYRYADFSRKSRGLHLQIASAISSEISHARTANANIRELHVISS